jgi:hypothetical protein
MEKNQNWRLMGIFTITICLSVNLAAQNVSCKNTYTPVPDEALENAGLATPKPAVLDISALIPADFKNYINPQVRFRAAILSGDYLAAQAYWDHLAAIADASERMRQLYALHFAISPRGLYYLDASRNWLKAQPQSIAAQTFHGMVMSYAASQARGSAYSGQTSDYAMAVLAQRFVVARLLLEPISLRKDIYAWAAHISLKLPYYFLGDDIKAWAAEEYLIEQAPQYGFSYFWGAEYTEPQWADAKTSSKRLTRLLELAQKHKLNNTDMKVLEQSMAHVRLGMSRSGNPQAIRPYWSKRIEQSPHLFNLLGRLTYEVQMQNWEAIDELATKALALNPYQTYSLYHRGVARRETGRFDDAFKDLVAAAVLGNDDAMNMIIQGHIRGTLGFKSGDFKKMLTYCQMGAALGLPSAANCMGAAHGEAIAGTVRDEKISAAWHLIAARGNYSNSQHDIATLAPKVASKPQAPQISVYWMREAAKQGHVYAKNKASPEPEIAQNMDWKCLISQTSQTVAKQLTDWIQK